MKSKHIIKNSILVFALFGLFTLPFVASGFIEYDDSEQSVLGAQSTFVVHKPAGEYSYSDKSDRLSLDELKEKRVDIDLNLSSKDTQIFYDVLNGILENPNAKVTVILSKDYENKGFVVSANQKGNKVNLVVKVPNGFEGGTLPVTLLIIE